MITEGQLLQLERLANGDPTATRLTDFEMSAVYCAFKTITVIKTIEQDNERLRKALDSVRSALMSI